MMAKKEGKINVLHVSSRYEECGVAKYLAQHMQGMVDAPGIHNEYFDVSPYATHHMSTQDLTEMVGKLRRQLKGYDVLHVQHEFGLYGHDSFRRIVETGKRAGKKVVVTVHISPSMHGASKTPRLKGLGPRSFMKYLRESRNHRHFLYSTIEPFSMADKILVHNEMTKQSLGQFGLAASRIEKVGHPVQVYNEPPASHNIAKALRKQKGDVIYACVGFLHRYKGMIEAVKALKFLPDNYKLAILGGMKADSDDVAFYNKLCELIDRLGVRDRVYITGYIHGDDQLNAAIRECDMCVYPFDRTYYASVSSGSLNLAFANGRPVIAYPTVTIKEMAADADGAVVLCETFAYYELAREIGRLDTKKQAELSKAYAKKMAWPKVSKQLVEIYTAIVQK
jgi:glycosyltransferase involved in cell wall biosynthesis